MADDEPGVPTPPRKGPRPDITECMEYFKGRLGINPDGGYKENRMYFTHLLNHFSKEYPDHDPVETTKRLIDIAIGDSFHRGLATKVSYLWFNKGRLILLGKQQREQQRLRAIEAKQVVQTLKKPEHIVRVDANRNEL